LNASEYIQVRGRLHEDMKAEVLVKCPLNTVFIVELADERLKWTVYQ
jgi:hypothetical protein